MTHTEGVALANRAKNKQRGYCGYANNTTVRLDGDDVVIRLHNTDIVRIRPDCPAAPTNGDCYVLNTGGWKTATTKDRIKHVIEGWNLFTDHGRWFLRQWCRDIDKLNEFYDKSNWVAFEEGMMVWANGHVVGEGEWDPAADRKLKKQIKEYVDGFWNALVAGEVGLPSGGDCFACQFKMSNTNHVELHMEEKYYVPSLLINAITDFSVGLAIRQFVSNCMHGAHEDALKSWWAGVAEQQVKSSLRRWMNKQLGFQG